VRPAVDELVAVATPDPFETVSAWYDDFAAVSDAEVLRLLGRAPETLALAADGVPDSIDECAIAVPVVHNESGHAEFMTGDLGVPNDNLLGLVILAHGGGSSRNSYRNRYLAGRLRQAGWATMRIDLLLDHERAADAIDGEARFDIPRIAARLRSALEWAVQERASGADRLVLFGASTGASAALVAAAARPDLVIGVASRGGRVDLAGAALPAVRAPVLMIVGGADVETLRRTRESATLLSGSKRLMVVPGAGHTFDEPGKLGIVGEHVVKWLEPLGRRRSVRRDERRT
jgi:putative phosphoribosyl transferase